MGYLEQIHQREAAEERTVETPNTTVEDTPKVDEPPKVEEPPKEEPPKVEEPPKEEPPKQDEPPKEEPPKQDDDGEKKPPKDLSGLTKEEKAAFAFKKQLAKKESKFEEALKTRDAEIENLKKAIAEMKAPKETKKRSDFEYTDDYIEYLAQNKVESIMKDRDAKAAEEKAQAEKDAQEQQEIQERTQEAIENFRTAVKEAFTDEAQVNTFKANVAKAYRNGLTELLDAVPPAKSFLLENGTTGVRVLDKILSDRNTFGRVFKPNQDPVSMLIELHAIAHEVNQPTQKPAVQSTQDTQATQAPKKTAIGRPGQGQGGAPGDLHGRELILHMRKVAQGGRRS